MLLLGQVASAWAGELGSARSVVKMTVREVRQDRGTPVVLLQSADGGRLVLPIWIGTAEAQVIQLRLNHQQAVRPLTLDLLQSILGALGTRVERVEVDDLKDNVFHGKVTLRDARGRRYRVDGRPSDLIGMALGAKLPVWVAPKVLEKAGQDISKWTSSDPSGGAVTY
jgi:bifunctional DNase/RNase